MRQLSARAFIVLGTVLLATFGVAAQWQGYETPGIPRTADGKPNLTAPVPRAPNGKPDLTGIWMAPRIRVELAQGLKKGETVPFTPEGRALADQRRANNGKDDPGARCLPTGVPVRATLQTPFKILQTPQVTAILYESRTQFRQILTDGRPLPKEIDWPTWQGFSIGRWDGDTFVVESAGFNGKAWLDQVGHPSTEKLRVTERFTRRDFGHMDVVSTIDDPNAYKKPWSYRQPLSLLADTELLELVCNENNTDLPHLKGK